MLKVFKKQNEDVQPSSSMFADAPPLTPGLDLDENVLPNEVGLIPLRFDCAITSHARRDTALRFKDKIQHTPV